MTRARYALPFYALRAATPETALRSFRLAVFYPLRHPTLYAFARQALPPVHSEVLLSIEVTQRQRGKTKTVPRAEGRGIPDLAGGRLTLASATVRQTMLRNDSMTI
jgi:hypothetical protein